MRQPLTLDDALRIASEKNRDLQKAHEYKRWVEGRYVEERSAALPHLRLTGGALKSWDNTFQLFFGDVYPASQQTFTTSVSLSQTLYAWGKVGAAIDAAREGIASADDLLNVSRSAAVRQTTEAFVDVLLARALETIAADTLAQRERHLAEAKKKFDLGVATDYDVLSATVSADNARPDVIHSANLVRTAMQRLRLVLGEPELDREVVGELIVPLTELPSVDAVVAEALASRPDLLELEHRIGVYEQLVKIARADDKPSFELRAGY
ncbi:MAG: TolC family protein, partial [Thermoanaerobaculia bacterium]